MGRRKRVVVKMMVVQGEERDERLGEGREM